MIMEKQVLINEYVKCLRNKSATVFLGAGMSYGIFSMAWNKLIAPYKEKLKIQNPTITNPQIAQYILNQGCICENEFKHKIASVFISDKFEHKHSLLAKLPILNYWTTNYDHLMENAIKNIRVSFEKKSKNSSFSITKATKNKNVYKIHGDIDDPGGIVITEDDYDSYEINNPNFYTALENEFASNNILFLGYSFNDKNINAIFNKVKQKNSNRVKHFFITEKEVELQKINEQQMWITQQEKLGIQTLLIGNYLEIEPIIKEVYKQYMAYKIFVSGSAVDYGEFGGADKVSKFLHDLGRRLVETDGEQGLEIINGNGLGVGPILKEGISLACVNLNYENTYWVERPFDSSYYKLFKKPFEIEQRWSEYRNKIIDKCGVVFFVFGNKKNDVGDIVNADGVRKEFDIAVKQGKYVFPIGATGYMAKELADEVLADFEKYNGVLPNIKERFIEMCNAGVSMDRIIENIIYIIDALAFRDYAR